MRASKEATIVGMGMPLERALDSVFPAAQQMYESEDLVEGPRAFAEKRLPNWERALIQETPAAMTGRRTGNRR